MLELTERFVCVRLIQMGGVDLSVFQFDPFLSWSVFFMNADKTIYGRFGQTHPDTKRAMKDSNPSHALDGLKASLSKALEIHANYTKDPESWRPALAGKTGPAPRWRYAEKTPAARKYKRLRQVSDGEEEGCVHCHEVLRTAIDSHFIERVEVPDNMLWLYPRPQVLGLDMDKRHCARVSAVAPDSVAATAGVRAGDDIVTLGGQPLLSVADLQWVLQNFRDEGGALPLEVERAGKKLALTMELADGWRRDEDFGWRYRMAGYASWLWAGVSFEDDSAGVRVAQRAPNWFKAENKDAKQALRPGDVIVEIDKKTGLDRSDLIAYLMREKEPGSTVKLVVLRGGEREKVSFKIPKKRPELQWY